MIAATPTCPLCDSPARPELPVGNASLPFSTADPRCDYWRCVECDWLYATPKRDQDPDAHCPACARADLIPVAV